MAQALPKTQAESHNSRDKNGNRIVTICGAKGIAQSVGRIVRLPSIPLTIWQTAILVQSAALQVFVPVHNEPLSGTAMGISNPDSASLKIHG